MDLIHKGFDQVDPQAAKRSAFNIPFKIWFGYCRRIEWLSMVLDDHGQACIIGITSAFNVTLLFPIIGMFDNVGTGFIHRQFHGISLGIVHAGISRCLGGKPTDGV